MSLIIWKLLLQWTFPYRAVLIFSLGKKCADIYLSFKANTSKVKSSRRIEMTYENKKKSAVGLAPNLLWINVSYCLTTYKLLSKLKRCVGYEMNLFSYYECSTVLLPNVMQWHPTFIAQALPIGHFWLICAKMKHWTSFTIFIRLQKE